MYRSKTKYKGYIVTFTLIIISIIMSIFLYLFNIEISKKMRNHSYKSIELNEDIYSKKREYILARLNRYIMENFKYINEDNIELILNNINDQDITYENAFVRFDNENKNIIVNLENEKGVKIEEIYNYELDKNYNIVRFKYLDTKYK
ncbi:hypothetical protein FDB54_10890 [Clostridium botulinum]|nr:hypothetical protein [Clostridium botulinum]